jgi:hypothetical protein
MELPRPLVQRSATDRQAYLPRPPWTADRTLDLLSPRRNLAVKGSAVGLSVVGHVAVLGLGLMFAGANPLDAIPADAIVVDIVSPDEVSSPDSSASNAVKAETPPSGDLLSAEPVPPLSAVPTEAAPSHSPAPAPALALALAPTSPQPAPRGRTTAQQGAGQASAKPQQREQARPTPFSPIPYPPSATPPVTPPDPQQPNFTDMFGLPVALPDGQLGGGFDAPAYDTAKIAPDQTAAFLIHLKTCSSLPGTVSADDKVRIVLRVAFSPEGKLAGNPTLIEATASAKGPLLMQSAIKALRQCQPYTMLPADRYEEWKVLDLTFTPHDLAGG